MFVTPAYAQASPFGGGDSLPVTLLPFVLIFGLESPEDDVEYLTHAW